MRPDKNVSGDQRGQQTIPMFANITRSSSGSNYLINMFPIQRKTFRPAHNEQMQWSSTVNDSQYPVIPIYQNTGPDYKGGIVSTVKQKKISKSKSAITTRSVVKYVEEYFSSTMLHGLRYAGDTSVSMGERLFWICTFIAALCSAAYFITTLFTKYNTSPIIISLNPTPVTLRSLPFPAITICSTNNAKRQQAELILQNGTNVDKMLIDHYCNIEATSNQFMYQNTLSDEATRWENVESFLFRVNPTISETMRYCLWKKQEVVCDDVFNNVLTDDGLCYTFNSMPGSVIYRNPLSMAYLNLTYPPEVDDWNPERGFSPNSNLDASPRRAAGPGTHLGFTVVLDARVYAYYCSSVSSIGFKVLLHNPLETPKMAEYAMLVAPGNEARIIIEPKIFDATASVKDIDLRKRDCYFVDERRLQFFRVYSEVNCKQECQANYTLETCGCVPYFLPKNRNTEICSKRRDDCVRGAKEIMETTTDSQMNCNCLPACFEVNYEATATYAKLSDVFRPNEKFIQNETTEYFKRNMAVLHFYFVDSQFTRNSKSVIYGFSEFLSNTGGLLGVFSGFSFISVVEILYYLSLKLLCKKLRSGREIRQSNKTEDSRNNLIAVYPFSR